MSVDKISKLEERKRKLEEQIKEEKEKDLLQFAKWFYNKYKVDNSKEAKKVANNITLPESSSEENYNSNYQNS